MRKCPATENKSAGVLRLQNNPFASHEDVKSSSLSLPKAQEQSRCLPHNERKKTQSFKIKVCARVRARPCVSLNNLAHNLAGSQRPWADCCHGNLTASISLAHTFPLNSRPMTDQPTGKSGSPEARAPAPGSRVCVRACVF